MKKPIIIASLCAGISAIAVVIGKMLKNKKTSDV